MFSDNTHLNVENIEDDTDDDGQSIDLSQIEESCMQDSVSSRMQSSAAHLSHKKDEAIREQEIKIT